MQPTATTAEKGGKAGTASASRTAALGGPTNAGLSMMWLVIAIVGAILAMAGLSALQNYVNSSTAIGTNPSWWNAANFARLGSATVFRLPWWSWAWTVITIATLVLAFASDVIPTARISLVSFCTVASLLCMWSANMTLDVVSQHISPAHTSAARCAAAGFIISALAFLALMYSIGLTHHY